MAQAAKLQTVETKSSHSSGIRTAVKVETVQESSSYCRDSEMMIRGIIFAMIPAVGFWFAVAKVLF